HACLNVTSLETKHLLALAGIYGVSRISNDAAISRRFANRAAGLCSIRWSVRGLHRRYDILLRTVADLNSSLEITLRNVNDVSPITHLHLGAFTRAFEHGGIFHRLPGGGCTVGKLQIIPHRGCRWRGLWGGTIRPALRHQRGR